MHKTKHLLSIDLEDWFHILDYSETKSPSQWDAYPSRILENTDRLLSLFEKHNVKATFFVLAWVAEKFPNLVLSIKERGHDIGSHSYAHQLIYVLTPEQFEADLCRSISILEDLTQEKIISFRAPGFSITEKSTWAFEILAKNGITIDSSVFPASRSHGGLPDFPEQPFLLKTDFGDLMEFPISTFNVFNKKIVYSGGGYFRLAPKWFLDRQFSKSTANNKSIITYLHPRDIDPNQPKLDMSRLRSFKTYVNLDSTLVKLEYLISKYKFTSIKELSTQQNFEKSIDFSNSNKARTFSFNN